MDPSTGVGLFLAVGALLVTVLMEGGELHSLWTPSSFILIFFGTIGMTVASFPMNRFRRIPALLRQAFFARGPDAAGMVERLGKLAEKARREGLLALEDEIGKVANPLLRRGLTMVVDGTDPEQLRANLETQVELRRQEQEELAGIFEQAGGYSPTVGIIGTVMGLVHVLGNLSDVDRLGPLIAVAFLATFYGIFFANVFWLPLAHKLKVYAQEEARLGEMIIEGLVSLQAGENPNWLREKLSVYVSEDGRPKHHPEESRPVGAVSPREAGD